MPAVAAPEVFVGEAGGVARSDLEPDEIQIRRYIKQRPDFKRAGEHLIATFERGLLRINTL